MDIAWYNILGGIGSALIIGTYFLLQMDRLKAETVLYGTLNLFGAGFILISLVFDFNLAAFVVEFFWAAISLMGIFRHTGRASERPGSP